MLSFRLIDPSDYPVLKSWWDERPEAMEWEEAVLPPLGCLSLDAKGPAAAVWAHMSVGIGVAVFEYACTRPGLGVVEAMKAFQCAAMGLEAALLVNNYNYFIGHTRPGAERVMTPIGWKVGCRRPKVSLYKQVPLDACAEW